MPLPTDKRRQMVLDQGLDPALYDYDESKDMFVAHAKMPVVVQEDDLTTSSALKPDRVKASALGAAGRGFLSNLLPTAGSLAAGGAAMTTFGPPVAAAFPPAAPITVPLVGLAGGLLGGKVVGDVQERLMPQGAKEQLAQDAQDQPWATFAGGAASALPALKPGLGQIKQAGSGLVNLLSKLGGIETQVTPGQVGALANTAVQSAPSILRGLEGEQSPGMTAADIAINALLSRPTKFGQKAFGLHPDVPDAQYDLYDKARVGNEVLEPTRSERVPEDNAARMAEKQARVDAERKFTMDAEREAVAKGYAQTAKERTEAAYKEAYDIQTAKLKGEEDARNEAERRAKLDAEIRADAEARETRLKTKTTPDDLEQMNRMGEDAKLSTKESLDTQAEVLKAATDKPPGQMATELPPDIASPSKTAEPVDTGKLIPEIDQEARAIGEVRAEHNQSEQDKRIEAFRATQPKFKLVGEQEAKRELNAPATKGIVKYFEELGAKFRGIKTDIKGNVTKEDGTPLRGKAIVVAREGVNDLIAQVSRKFATGDTVGHEQFHFFWEYLKTHPSDKLRGKVDAVRKEVEQSPDYLKWKSTAPDANVDEYIVQRVGEGMFKRVANKSTFDGVKDVLSSLKSRLGNATVEDYARLLGRKYMFDPAQGDTIAKSLTPSSNDKKPKDSEIGAQPIYDKDSRFTTTTETPDSPKPRFWESFASSQIQKVRDLGSEYKPVADSLSRFFNRRSVNEAKFVNVPLKETRDMDAGKLSEAMTYAQNWMNGERGSKAPDTDEMRWVQKHFLDAANTQIAEDLKVYLPDGTTRTRGVSDYYAPQILNDEVLKEFSENPLSAKSKKFVQEWVDHVVALSGQKPEDVRANIQAYIDAQGSGVTRTVDFNALTKAQGYGLPEHMREADPFRIITKYGNRVAKTLAYWKELQSNPTVAGQLKLTQPDGKLSPLQPGTESVAGAEAVDAAMKFVLGDFHATENSTLNGIIRVVNNSLMGLPTGLRDLVSVPGIASNYIPVKDSGVFLKAATKLSTFVQDSLAAGARKGRLSLTDFRGIVSPDATTEMLNKTAEAFRKYQGRDALEQVSRIYTFGIGKLEAEIMHARALNGDTEGTKWLKQFSELVDKPVAEWGQAELNQVAKNFVDRVQGTGDARGLSTATVHGQLAPLITLNRWGIERFNNFREDVIKPATRGDLSPLLKSTLGAVLTGAAIKELNELLSGKKAPTPSMTESLNADDMEAATAEAINLVYLGSYAGILGDVLKASVDVGINKQAPRLLGMPAAEVPAELGQAVIDFKEAQENGQDTTKTALVIAASLLRRHIQNLNYAMNRADLEGETTRKNEERDLRVFRRLEGKDKPFTFSTSLTGDAVNSDEKQFKRTTDMNEAATLSQDLVQKALAKATLKDGTVDVAELNRIISGYKRSPEKSIPTDPIEQSRYANWLGPDEFVNRYSKSASRRAYTEAKNNLLPRF